MGVNSRMYSVQEEMRELEDQAEDKNQHKKYQEGYRYGKDKEKLRGMDDKSGVDDMNLTGVSEKEKETEDKVF